MRQQGRGLRGEFLAKYMDMMENTWPGIGWSKGAGELRKCIGEIEARRADANNKTES